MDFLTEDKLSVTDFLQIEKKKILRISIINDARSTKEKCRGRGGAPFKLLWEGAAAPSLVAPLVNTCKEQPSPPEKKDHINTSLTYQEESLPLPSPRWYPH